MRFFIFKKVFNKEQHRPRRSKNPGSDPRNLLIQTRFAIRLDRRFLLDTETEKLYPKNNRHSKNPGQKLLGKMKNQL